MVLKRNKAIIWLLLSIITCNISVLFLGKKLKVYDKNAWYTRWYYWVLGIFFGIFPAIVMLFIFIVQTNIKVCGKLDVPGYELYRYPYVWIGCLIVPILGWTIFLVLLIYLYVMYLIRLFQGKGEKYQFTY